MKNFWDKIKEFRNVIVFITTIVTATGGFTAYFATAEDLQRHVQEFYDYRDYQRLDYLDRRIAQLEDRHDCFNEGCRSNMPISVWEEYREKRVEKLRLEKVLVK